MAAAIKTKLTNATRSVNRQVPFLAYLGFGAWAAWNMIAFSGSAWLEDTANTWRVADMFVYHIIASIIALIAIALLQKRCTQWIARWPWPVIAGVSSTFGAILVIMARPSILESLHLFILGCMLTGLGTTMLFARCAALFGALKPRTSFILLCAAIMCGNIVYCAARLAPPAFGLAFFLLLPIIGASILLIHPYSAAETATFSDAPRITSQFYFFLVALFVFSLAAQVMLHGLYPLPHNQAVYSSDYSTVLNLIILTALALGAASSSKQFGFGRLYLPATLAIVAMLILLPFINIGITTRTALSSTANDIFNLLAWGMLAYVIFQAQGNALRVFCLGNAALALGSLVGSILTGTLADQSISNENFTMICLVLALLAIIVSLFVFPEHKIGELLSPIDESRFEPNNEDDNPFAPWKAACHELADQGGLTEREEEIFTLFARGKTTQQIADQLFISTYTVRAHTRSIYSKLDIHSRSDLSERVAQRVNASKGDA